MGARRQFGNVRQLPSGRWQARYPAGRGRLETAPTTFATKAQATRWLSTVETDQARGLWLDPLAGKTALAEYARSWLDGKARIAPRTREIYEVQIRLHIAPAITKGVSALGEVPIGEITPELVRAWYGALRAERGPSIAAKAYTRLRQIMAQAVADDRIAKNPCRIDGGGVERHPEQRFATLPQLFDLAGAVPDRYRALVLTNGLDGLRPGESFALRRGDVDLLAAETKVRRKRLRLASGEIVEDDPKTQAGRRTVAIPEPLVTELKRHLLLYTGPEPDAYVFTSATGRPIDATNFRNRVWIPATVACGLQGLRFYDLRHTAGTMAARTGATIKELMARLGHASSQAAMVYQHAAGDRDHVIAEGLTAMIAEAGLAPVEPLGPSRRRAARRGKPARSGTDMARRPEDRAS